MNLKSSIFLFVIVFVSQLTIFAQTNEGLINQAKEAIEKQDYVSALSNLDKVLKSEPKNDAAMAERARVLYFQKKNAESLALIEKVLAVNPKNFTALNLRGIIKQQNNDLAGSVADFTSAIAANSNFTKAYVNRAKSNERLKVAQKQIIEDYLKARELDPKSVVILQELINYCLFSTEFKCVSEIDDLMKLNPSANAYYLRGLQAMVKGFGKARLGDDFWADKAKLAVADIEKAVALDKNVLNSGRNYQNVARIYAHAKNYPVALDYFAKQIAFDEKNGTKNVSAYVLRSEIYMTQGDYESASKEFDLIEKLDAKVPQIYLGRGQISSQKKDYDNALVHFKKAVEAYPSSESFINLAFVYSRKRDFANAETSLKQSYANHPKNSWIRATEITHCKSITVNAEIELNKGNTEKAGDLFSQASNKNHDIDAKCMANAAYQYGELTINRFPLSAIDAYQRVIDLDLTSYPDAPEKLNQAKANDRRKVGATANNAPTKNSDLARGWYRSGLDQEKEKKYDDALKSYGECIRLNPEEVFCYTSRAGVYEHFNKPNEALADYTKATQLSPKYINALISRGELYAKYKKLENAKADFLKAIEINPKDTRAYGRLGKIYAENNDNEKALSYFTRAIEVNPKSDSAFLNRGEFYSKLKKYNEAIADLLKVIEINPKYTNAYIKLGNAYGNLGRLYDKPDDYEKAVAYYSKSIELTPNHADTYRVRGMAYYALHKNLEAIADFSKAIELNPKLLDAFDLRATVYCGQGKKALAQADEKKVVELGGTVSYPCK